MSADWPGDLRTRLNSFEHNQKIRRDGISLSIKVRVIGGCFHREHSSNAYKIIDAYLQSANLGDSISFEEHESGPELLVFFEFFKEGIPLLKDIIELIMIIIKARSEGIKKGDRPSEPLELIVRFFDKDEKLFEERILHIDFKEIPDKDIIQRLLNQTFKRVTPTMLKKLRGIRED
jgi:hypothetical protein